MESLATNLNEASPMLVLSAADVRASLPMHECIEAMKRAFGALASGRAVVPLRAQLPVEPHDGVTLVMPALVEDGDVSALVVKVVSVFGDNPSRDLARVQAAVLVLETETGRLLAMLEGATLTAIRTAACSGAATDLLARRDSRVLGVLGSGVQARTHIEAICCVRPIEIVRVFAPTAAHVEALVEDMTGRGVVTARIEAAASASEAVAGADVVCATTTSKTPVLDDADVAPGVHVNAVGSYTPGAAEIPPETVARARVVVDDREAAWEEAGDLIGPLEAGLIDRDHVVASLGDLVNGTATGRTDESQVTMFKSVGLAVQDAFAARLALDNAQRDRRGQAVDW